MRKTQQADIWVSEISLRELEKLKLSRKVQDKAVFAMKLIAGFLWKTADFDLDWDCVRVSHEAIASAIGKDWASRIMKLLEENGFIKLEKKHSTKIHCSRVFRVSLNKVFSDVNKGTLRRVRYSVRDVTVRRYLKMMRLAHF